MDHSYSLRHIAIPSASERILFAISENIIYLWDTKNNKQLSEFRCELDFGGKRLETNSEATICFAGTYNQYGVAAYNSLSGIEIWRRKDINKFQKFVYDPHTNNIYCITDDRCWLLNSQTGETVAIFRDIKDLFLSPFSDEYISLNDKIRYHSPFTNKKFFIEPKSFGLLTVAFGDEHFGISEPTRSVRFFSKDHNEEIYAYNPFDGFHILRMCWTRKYRIFIGIEWGYKEGGCYSLLHFDIKQGKVKKILELQDLSEIVFSPNGESFLSSKGELRSSLSGELILKLRISKNKGAGPCSTASE